jgi:hypothetical protein
MSRFPGWSALLLFVLSTLACGEAYRVEPLLLERSDVARTIVANQSDADAVSAAEVVVARFVKLLQGGDCGGAWQMLTPAYRARFARVAADDDAQKLFCDGYKVDGEMLVKGDWVQFLLGAQAFYLTSVPPELGYAGHGGVGLFYVVQKDGSYRALLVEGAADRARLEPF